MRKLILVIFTLILIGIVDAQPTAGLVAYWSMNANFIDNGPNNIAVTNTGSTPTTNYYGEANTAMNFLNPVSSSFSEQFATHVINSNVNFSGSQDFSIDFSAYANFPFVRAGGFYDNNINNAGIGIWFWNSPGYPELRFNYKNGSIGTTNGAFPLGEWKHVCCVRAAGILKIYINGALNVSGIEGALSATYPYSGKFGTMFFNGYSPPEYNGLNGKLDEFRIYNRALTAAEIQELSDIVIPVKLSSFTAINKNNIISLNWQTQYEQNSSHFNIQRSSDGILFSEIARVAATGNTNSIHNYSHNDPLTAAMQMKKTVFYRLQSVDTDGKFSYSQVIALQLDKKEMELFISPNPARDVLQVQMGISIACNASLIISDMTGKNIYRKEVTLQQGSNSIPINISLLGKGTYNVRLVNGKEIYVKQFVKE